MQDPLISLALPIMNGMPGIRRTVEALRRQSYKNFQLIVQDGGSGDGSLDYLKHSDLPAISIVSEPDSGKGQAYNRAIRRCQGPLVVALACDEWLEPNALETFVRWYKLNPRAAFCYGGTRLWRTETEMNSEYHGGQFELMRFIMSEQTPTVAGFYNKEIIGDDLYLDETLTTCPDFDLFIRLGVRFTPAEIVEKPEVVLNAMVDRSSQTYRAEEFDQFARDRLSILVRFFREQGSSPLIRYFRNACISSMYIHLAASLRDLVGETAQVRHYILEAARHRPDSPKVAQLVAESKHLFVDPETGEVLERRAAQPALPPTAAVPVNGVLEIDSAETEQEWIAAGAIATVQGSRVRVKTSWAPWSEAARLPFRLDRGLPGGGWYWVELFVEVQSGQVAIAARAGSGELRREQVVGPGRAERFVIPFSSEDSALVVRNASAAGPSVANIGVAAVLGMAMPFAEIYARSLATHLNGALDPRR